MPIEILQGLAIPFLGTTLGAACVFLLRGELDHRIQKAFTGFAAGIMVAASVWSLLIPSMEESSALGSYAVLPAVVGFWVGTLFLLLLDHIIPHLHLNSNEAEGPKSALSKNLKLVLAVTLHNIPEGMAVGVVLAGWLTGGTKSRSARRSHCHSASQSRISRRARSSRCRSRPMARGARRRSCSARSRASWSRLAAR